MNLHLFPLHKRDFIIVGVHQTRLPVMLRIHLFFKIMSFQISLPGSTGEKKKKNKLIKFRMFLIVIIDLKKVK